MILAFDTYYRATDAKTICIAFTDWESDHADTVYTDIYDIRSSYIPGSFYKRELPCILHLFNEKISEIPETIIVDGFVYLDDDDKPGLGARLYIALDRKVPVVGVAKTNFATIINNKRAVYRGRSRRPLFVTAAGMPLDTAAKNVKSMSGNFRIPLLLNQLDRLSRK